MKEVTREDLLKGGFTEKEIALMDGDIVKQNVTSGKYENSLKYLRRVFFSGVFLVVFTLIIFFIVVINHKDDWVELAVLFTFPLIVICFLTPIKISFKSYRFYLKNK